MANEARVTSLLGILKTDGVSTQIDYQSRPNTFTATVTGTKGPTPGAIRVSTLGTDLDLSELTVPGFYRVSNQDSNHYIEIGIYDPENNKFYPLNEIQPGESYIGRFSRNLTLEYGATGTDSTGPATNRVRLRAYNQPCNALVEVFES